MSVIIFAIFDKKYHFILRKRSMLMFFLFYAFMDRFWQDYPDEDVMFFSSL